MLLQQWDAADAPKIWRRMTLNIVSVLRMIWWIGTRDADEPKLGGYNETDIVEQWSLIHRYCSARDWEW